MSDAAGHSVLDRTRRIAVEPDEGAAPVSAERIPDVPVETVACLRAAVRAAHALGRLDSAFERSAVRDAAACSFELLDVVAAVALERGPLDSASVLLAPAHRQEALVARALESRVLAHAALADGARGLDVDLLLQLGARENGGRRGVRRRGLARAERATLATGERVPRGTATLEDGLQRWVDLLARDGGDVQSLVLIGAAHGRWLALRPFASGNVAIAQTMSAVLLRDEGWLAHGCVPLARRFAGCVESYRTRLAACRHDESAWLSWWLESLADASEQTLQRLCDWECCLAALARSPASLHARPQSTAFVAIACPAFEQQDALAASGLSRAAGLRWLDGLVGEGRVRPIGGTRQRRYANVDVNGLLLG